MPIAIAIGSYVAGLSKTIASYHQLSNKQAVVVSECKGSQ